MNLAELKVMLSKNQVPEQLIIFLCSENTFLADQYTDKICELQGNNRLSINALSEQDSALSLVFDFDACTKVLRVDTFDEFAEDYSLFEHTIVICSKIDKKIKSMVDEYIVEIPKMLDWHIKDYIKSRCSFMQPTDIDWLYNATNGDIYHINNELDKITIFEPAEQKVVLASLQCDPASDLYGISLFTLVDALMERNATVVASYLSHRDNQNIEMMGLTNTLLAKIKQLILIAYDSGKSAADIGVSPKQFSYLKATGKKYPIQRLQTLLEKLSAIDIKLKSGLLDMSKAAQIDYIISTVFSQEAIKCQILFTIP